MIRFRCPQCEAKMEVDESFAGRTARCATCGNTLKIPRQSEPAPRPGAATGPAAESEKVEVVPPIELTAIIGAAAVGLSVLVWLIMWQLRMWNPPLMVACLGGAMMAALGTMIALSAWNIVHRSRGRKRGKRLTNIALLGGAGLFVVFLVGAVVDYALTQRRPTCEQNLTRIHAALLEYAGKHEGAFPPSLRALVDEKELDSANWLTCPQYQEAPGSQTYEYVKGIDLGSKSKALFPGNMMVVSDGAPYNRHDDGVRVLFLDGTIDTKPKSEFEKYKEMQGKQWQEIQRKLHPPAQPPATPAPAPVAPPPEAEEPPATVPPATPAVTPTAPTATPPATPAPTVPATPAAPKAPVAASTVPPATPPAPAPATPKTPVTPAPKAPAAPVPVVPGAK
jgi:hypothetical protein